MISLFEGKRRTRSTPANDVEDTYSYLDVSAREDMSIARELLNEWFGRYPASEKAKLKKDFQTNFDSAFFELFIHELFTRLGFGLRPHPNLKGTLKKVDFLASKDDLEIYLEARLATGLSEKEEAEKKFKNLFYHHLNRISLPNFFLHVRELKFLSGRQPTTKKVIKKLMKQVATLDPDDCARQVSTYGAGSLPFVSYKDDDVDIDLVFLPISNPTFRGQPNNRPIGMAASVSFTGGTDEFIQLAVGRKTNRYGSLEKPYIVCINSINFRGTRDDDVMKAMYGSHQINFPPNPNVWNETILNISSYKGYFESNSEAKRGLTGVFVTNVCPFNLHNAKHWLCLNPSSTFPLDFDNLGLGYFRKELQKLHGVKGKTIREILDLPVDWM